MKLDTIIALLVTILVSLIAANCVNIVYRPAESHHGPRGRPLSGSLHIPSPFPLLPIPSQSPGYPPLLVGLIVYVCIDT